MTLYLRYTDDETITNSFNHFTGEQLNGVCAFRLDGVEENGLMYEIRNNTNATYQDFYNGNFIVFTGTEIGSNFNNEGVIVELDEIVARGKTKSGDYGWVIDNISFTDEKFENL